MPPTLPSWIHGFAEKLGKIASREGTIVLVLTLLAIATRFYQLGVESLWLDEAITYHRSRVPFAELVADAKKSHHNPAYFLLVKAWMQLGDSEAMLRAPSACAGVLKVLVVYGLGRIVGGRWVGLGAALVILLNPTSVSYDQEARMYALFALGASVAIAGVLWLLDHPEQAGLRLWRLARDAEERQVSLAGVRLAWLAFWGGSVVALYCQATAALFFASCSLVALLFVAFRPRQRRDFFLNWVLVNLAVLLAFSFWLIQLAEQTAVVARGGFWMKYPTAEVIRSSIHTIFFWKRVHWVWALIIALALFGSFALRKKPLLVVALWMLSVLGPGLLLIVSLRQPVFMYRQFLWAATPLSVLVGAGLVAPARRWRRVGALGAFGVLGVIVLQQGYYARMHKPRWRDALTFVKKSLQPGDVVLTTGHREVRLVEYYFGRKSRPLARFDYVDLRGRWKERHDGLIADAPSVWTIRSRAPASELEARKVLSSRGRRDVKRAFGAKLLVERYALKDVKSLVEAPKDVRKKRKKVGGKVSRKRKAPTPPPSASALPLPAASSR